MKHFINCRAAYLRKTRVLFPLFVTFCALNMIVDRNESICAIIEMKSEVFESCESQINHISEAMPQISLRVVVDTCPLSII